MQHAAQERLKALQKDCDFYKEVNAQLEMNQADLEKEQLYMKETSAAQLKEKDDLIKDLREQVSLVAEALSPACVCPHMITVHQL